MRSILAVILISSAISATQAKAAQPLPHEVQSAIDDAIKDCHEKVKFEKGFLTRRDINGDGIDDFILDYGHFACGANSILYCGSAGCETEVFASLSGGKFAKVLDENVRGIKFKTVRGRPLCCSNCMVRPAERPGLHRAAPRYIGTGKSSLLQINLGPTCDFDR